ncbi:serine/threonine-protein kinase [Pyxidicoccus sp. 3LG]
MSDTHLACLDADTTAAYAAHALAPEDARAVEEHIDSCGACRELVSMVAKAGWSKSTASGGAWSGGELSAHPVLPRGTRVGPFEIDQPLDAGGMGLVYTAHDVRLDRRVALKCVRERRGDPEQLLREAKLMAQLANPNVVPVYDVIEAYGQVFIAMELVVGRSLRQWMEAGPRAWKSVVDVFLEAGAGLAAAHAAGIVHGDVKPANILVGDDGRVRVTDFGLATLVSEQPGETQGVRGTPAYLAPEQRAGMSCDALGDQYSFCVSLHEALFGTLPGARPTRTVGLPRGVGRVLARGLLEEPTRRYPSMEALLGALRAARSPRWKWALGAVAATAASVGLAYVVGGRQVEVEQCAVAAAELASPWDEAMKGRLRRAFARTGLSYAGETMGRVEVNLDAWNAGFEDARQRACAASWFSRETPLERLPGQLSCLKDRVREVKALVSQLRDADVTVVQNSVAATERLTPVSRCAEAAPERGTPANAPAVQQLREQFATAHGLMESGKYRAALPLSLQLMQAAESLGDAPFMRRRRCRSARIR